ncbi:TPA: mechanosensitive channel protein, partial [Serratia liquefaciens]|nr:mechanosensitive channel protein [Serratia liquefaciens]
MPATAYSRFGSHLREQLFPLLLLLITYAVSPLATAQPAQDPAPSGQTEQQKVSYAALADILQDDKTRAELINHLRQAAGQPAAAQPKSATPEPSDSLSESLTSLAQDSLSTLDKKLNS